MKSTRVFALFSLIVTAVTVAVLYYFIRPSDQTHIRISSNPWIGFTPFIYAQEKGWLEETSFRFVWLVDLGDNARLYERGFTNGFTATQYEWFHFKNKHEIKPVFLIDRSSGADAILSNRTIDELRQEKSEVKVYLERGTMNEDFLKAFIRENALQGVELMQVDMSQKEIMGLRKFDEPVVIVSYVPYLSRLLERGYRTVASTRDINSFYVIDGLFVDEEQIVGREEEYKRLKAIFARAVEQLRRDPQEFYGTIYGYLEGQSYEAFLESTREIEWLHERSNEKALRFLESQGIGTQRLIR